MKKKIGIIIAVVIGALALLYGIVTEVKDTAAISIIGGADGPTSVFLAGKVGHGFSLIFIVIGAIILLIALVLFLRRRK